jgi:hypothetical protein
METWEKNSNIESVLSWEIQVVMGMVVLLNESVPAT